MAEYYIEKKTEINSYEEVIEIPSTDVMTGDRNRQRFLYYQLKRSIQKAKKVDIIVSFLMESGVKMILGDLRGALDRGVQVRLLTGNYLGITQPSALYLLKRELGNRVDLRFYHESSRSFHPKAYLFHYDTESEIYIGSSNVSKSALTSGIEWNYRFSSRKDEQNFRLFYETFEDLFYRHSVVIDDAELKRYSKSWHKPAVSKDLARYDAAENSLDTNIRSLYEPRGVQIEALYALEQSRREGARKGLVQAATGVGKTYLAAFDSVNYSHVLFVAHREEILKQAAISFQNVRQSEDYGFFNGARKDRDKSVIFASVSTLGQEEYLQERWFAPDYFDYIVVDEFHHAVNKKYRKITEYFQPKFLLGLTATPERMDGRNIYELCDYQVPYEISLKEAINKGILVPFHYYGIYDETDYSTLHVVKGRYDDRELNATYIGNVRRYDLIYKYYRKYASKRALGFCCSKQHAEDMAAEFVKRGIPAGAVYSNGGGTYSIERDIAIEKLQKGELNVLFSVDMFNEGVDIPSLDMILFLRPTQSPVVFLQQLGRGLRKCRGKEYVTVLDFIGNYEKAGMAPFLLSGKSEADSEVLRNSSGLTKLEYPDDCIVDFDMRLVESVFEKLERRSLTIRERIRQEYYRIKELLDGKVPTRMELFTYMENTVYQLCMNTPKETPFCKYLTYLHDLGELSMEEEELYRGIGREFLGFLETTNMQKVYKMPVLRSFYTHGTVKMAVTEEDVLESWMEFFHTGTNWRDLQKGITYEAYKAITPKQHLTNIKKNPVKFLKASGKGFFVEKEGYVLALGEELSCVAGEKAFGDQMKDIVEYRTMEYYRRRYVEGKDAKTRVKHIKHMV